MLHKALRKMQTERGATFSMALFLFLVCMVLSSAIIAAGSASAGQVAKRGKIDQRYFDVNSAVKLFSSWMGDDDTVVVGYTATPTPTISTATINGTVKGTSATKGAFDDVIDLFTRYALYGTGDMNETDVLIELVEGWSDWEEFKLGYWNNPPKSPEEMTANITVTPWVSELAARNKKFNSTIGVNGKLTKDWTLLLEFKNMPPADQEAADEYSVFTDEYSVLVTLQGSLENQLLSSDEGEAVSRVSNVTWQIVGVEPGGAI